MLQEIGRYEIRRELGRGGMATVYLAFDPRFRRQVAVKVLPRQFTHDPRFLSLFQQEAQTIASLEHPAIVPVYDFGEHDDAPYLVMRYMAGGSLRDRLSGEPLSLEQISAALDRLAPALDLAHERGVVHRDIKPSNILFDDAGNPYLADFGIARLAEATQTVSVIGTPAYNSPEQVEGKVKLDGRSDIYAVGIMLFELLSGKQPYQAETPTGQMMAHVLEPVPDVLEVNPDLPDWTQAVIAKAMAKDREERFQTTTELATALHNPDLVAPAAAEPGKPAKPAETAAPVAAAAAVEAAAPDTAEAVPASPPAEETPPVVEEAPPAAAASLPPDPKPESAAGADPPAATESSSPNWLYIAGGALAVLLLLIGIWAIFFRDGDQGGAEEPPIVDIPATETAAAIAAGEEPTTQATIELTEETIAPPPPDATEEAQEIDPPLAAIFATFEGDVTVVNDDVETAAAPDSIITEDTLIITGDDGLISFMLPDGTLVDLGQSTTLGVGELGDPSDFPRENTLYLLDGDILLRQSEPGSKVSIYDDQDILLGSLQGSADAAIKPARLTARRLAGEVVEEAAMAIGLNASDPEAYLSCFSGLCTIGDSYILPAGEEAIIDREEYVLLHQEPISTDSQNYSYWQTTCVHCLPEATAPVVQEDFAPLEPTADTGQPYTAHITDIQLDSSGRYVVSYETAGYTEQLPGRHVHFFFDTVSESEAGVPGNGPWIVYGGPRPFTQYAQNDRPNHATSLCVLVANDNHSVIPATGNCFPLP